MATEPTKLAANAVDNFLEHILSNEITSVPKGAQWIVQIGGLAESTGSDLITCIEKAYERQPKAKEWSTTESAKQILTAKFQSTNGCLFCQAIGLPGEEFNAVAEGNIKSNAFIRSYVGAGRNDFPKLKMTFLDTNTSFTDTFLRGWALATATFGLLARKDYKYRTTIKCNKLAITPNGPYISQIMTFHGACCISVADEEYQYTHATSPVLREAQFIYHNYTLTTLLLPTKNSFAPPRPGMS